MDWQAVRVQGEHAKLVRYVRMAEPSTDKTELKEKFDVVFKIYNAIGKEMGKGIVDSAETLLLKASKMALTDIAKNRIPAVMFIESAQRAATGGLLKAAPDDGQEDDVLVDIKTLADQLAQQRKLKQHTLKEVWRKHFRKAKAIEA